MKGSAGPRSTAIAAPASAAALSGASSWQRSVSQLHRTRLIQALMEVYDEGGLADASVARVVARAGSSRRMFYELFADRDACLLAALEHAVERAVQRAGPSYRARRQWADQVRAGLFALLEFFDEEPQLARLCLVLAPGASASLLDYRSTVVSELAQIVDRARGAGRCSPPPVTAQALVGGVLEVLRERTARREKEPLVSLLQPLMAMMMTPYFGAARASRELERSLPRTTGPGRAATRDPMPRSPTRLTWRTTLVLYAVSYQAGMSNREVADAVGIADAGQISKLLSRLQRHGLVHNTGRGQPRGEANSWHITDAGSALVRQLQALM